MIGPALPHRLVDHLDLRNGRGAGSGRSGSGRSGSGRSGFSLANGGGRVFGCRTGDGFRGIRRSIRRNGRGNRRLGTHPQSTGEYGAGDGEAPKSHSAKGDPPATISRYHRLSLAHRILSRSRVIPNRDRRQSLPFRVEKIVPGQKPPFRPKNRTKRHPNIAQNAVNKFPLRAVSDFAAVLLAAISLAAVSLAPVSLSARHLRWAGASGREKISRKLVQRLIRPGLPTLFPMNDDFFIFSRRPPSHANVKGQLS